MYKCPHAQVQCVFQVFLLQHASTGAADGFQLRFADVLGQVLCALNHTAMDVDSASGLRQLSALYQNAPKCIMNSCWRYADGYH